VIYFFGGEAELRGGAVPNRVWDRGNGTEESGTEDFSTEEFGTEEDCSILDPLSSTFDPLSSILEFPHGKLIVIFDFFRWSARAFWIISST
jgi:hypothetical protein